MARSHPLLTEQDWELLTLLVDYGCRRLLTGEQKEHAKQILLIVQQAYSSYVLRREGNKRSQETARKRKKHEQPGPTER